MSVFFGSREPRKRRGEGRVLDNFIGLSGTAWTGVTALATMLLVFYAASQLRSAAKDSRARSRPVLVPQLQPDKWANYVDLVMTNFGPSAAFDVQVSLVDGVVHGSVKDNSTTEMYLDRLMAKFAKPFPVWAPSQIERTHFVWGTDIDPEDDEAIQGIQVTISYSGADHVPRFWQLWKRWRRRRNNGEPQFSETFDLPLYHRFNDLHSSSSRDLDKQMAEIIKVIKTVAASQSRTATALESALELLPRHLDDENHSSGQNGESAPLVD